MDDPDLNLLFALDALLAEGSVVRAATRLGLSASATSRTLARLRAMTGDPLLVRAGRGLVPTPRAVELRERAARVVAEARDALRPAAALDPARLEATFTLRTSDGFVDTFGPALLARVARESSGVRLCFIPKLDRDTTVLRDGSVDLDTGVVAAATAPEVRARALFRDRFVGVVRPGHELARGSVTAAGYAAQGHVLGPRRADERAPIDEALAALGLERRVVVTVTGFAAALALVRGSDLVAALPEKHTAAMRDGLFTFGLPFASPEVVVSMLWHPRRDADPAHRWLRECLHQVCSDRRFEPRHMPVDVAREIDQVPIASHASDHERSG